MRRLKKSQRRESTKAETAELFGVLIDPVDGDRIFRVFFVVAESGGSGDAELGENVPWLTSIAEHFEGGHELRIFCRPDRPYGTIVDRLERCLKRRDPSRLLTLSAHLFDIELATEIRRILFRMRPREAHDEIEHVFF